MGVGYNPKIVTSGLVLALDAANIKSYPGSGTTWTDLSGNGNNGTLTNGPTFDSGNSGIINFVAASTQYVSVTDSASLSLTTATVETWVKFSTLNTRIIFCGKGDGVSNPTTEYWLEKTAGNKFSVCFSVGTPALNHPLNDTSVVANTWYHIVGTFDGSNVRGYVNGVQDSSVGSLYGNIVDTSINYSVGKLGTYPALYHNGSIAVNKIYNRALTAAEIQQNFNALRGRFGI